MGHQISPTCLPISQLFQQVKEIEVARYKPNISFGGQILDKLLIWQKMSGYEYYSRF